MAVPNLNPLDAARERAAQAARAPDAVEPNLGALSIHFRRSGVQPPSNVYITLDDCLVVNVLCNSANPPLIVVARLLRPDGVIAYNHERISAVSAATLTKFIFQLAEGFLLDVCVSAVGSTLAANECLVRVDLQHNSQAGTAPFATLAYGFVDSTVTVAWPPISGAAAAVSAGDIVSVASAVPAAGAEAIYTVPAGARLRVMCAFATLVTSAAVAARGPGLKITDGTNTLFDTHNYEAQAASLTHAFNFGPQLPETGDLNSETSIITMPAITLAPGWTIATDTDALDAADQWTALRVAVEQSAD
jgi:hypothetical protein